jgi:GGDEF domain-containing protein
LGDEFLLVFPRCPVKRAVEVWGRIEQNLKAFNEDGIKPYLVSLSHGFAEFEATGEKSVDELVSIADREMYKKKQRNPEQREPLPGKA